MQAVRASLCNITSSKPKMHSKCDLSKFIRVVISAGIMERICEYVAFRMVIILVPAQSRNFYGVLVLHVQDSVLIEPSSSDNLQQNSGLLT